LYSLAMCCALLKPGILDPKPDIVSVVDRSLSFNPNLIPEV
jgi:hypothetical protein